MNFSDRIYFRDPPSPPLLAFCHFLVMSFLSFTLYSSFVIQLLFNAIKFCFHKVTSIETLKVEWNVVVALRSSTHLIYKMFKNIKSCFYIKSCFLSNHVLPVENKLKMCFSVNVFKCLPAIQIVNSEKKKERSQIFKSIVRQLSLSL